MKTFAVYLIRRGWRRQAVLRAYSDAPPRPWWRTSKFIASVPARSKYEAVAAVRTLGAERAAKEFKTFGPHLGYGR